jgi:hypothetical protein
VSDSFERQPNESPEAWEAFCAYRDMEGRRSYLKVGQQLSKSTTLIKRWGERWDWQRRIGDYERAEDAAWRAERLRMRRSEAARQLKVYQSVANAGVARLIAIDPATLTHRELLEYVKLGLTGTATVLGMGEQDDNLTGVRIFVDPNILPAGGRIPDNDRVIEG